MLNVSALTAKRPVTNAGRSVANASRTVSKADSIVQERFTLVPMLNASVAELKRAAAALSRSGAAALSRVYEGNEAGEERLSISAVRHAPAHIGGKRSEVLNNTSALILIVSAVLKINVELV